MYYFKIIIGIILQISFFSCKFDRLIYLTYNEYGKQFK